jgi:benzil reductase ((S)-benzoin forming)
MSNAILITGCTHGLGRELALRFARENSKVYAVGRNEKLLNELAEISENIIAVVSDVATEAGRKIIIESVKKEKSISIIHNAAISSPSLISGLSEHLLREHFETNFFAPFLLNQKLLPFLKNNSRVLHISSAASELSLPGLMPYCTSKRALEHMTNCFNAEFKYKDIYFANLRPGMIDTPMQDKLRNSDESDLPGRGFYLEAKKDNKLMPPELAAEFVAWVMTKTDNLAFSGGLWDISDISHHKNWIK